MRYLLVIVLLLSAVAVCHAQDGKATKTEYSVALDTSKLDIGKQVDGIADALKKHLDGPLGMYYEAAVARNRIVGMVGTVVIAVFIVCFAVLGICAIRTNSKRIQFPCGLTAILGITFTFCLAPIWAHVVEMMLAPQYVAMTDILERIGTIVH